MSSHSATIVQATAFGGPEVLKLTEQAVADPGPGQVTIAVRAAGLNPIDYKQYSGSYGADATLLPLRLGMEAAGVVTAVGSGARSAAGPLAVGDEVIGFRVTGAYA
ncbi:MAG: hypothetical protein QOJ37_3581, partial [Pseudonocardiales bacterium]|nr:hypothetical protein [Pseudonocardiales bacterium]